MAFNDDATNASNTSPGNDVGSLPTNAPAAPPLPVSPSPATAAPSPAPTARPAPQPAAPLPTHENRPTHSFAEAIRHSLLGAAIAEMAKKAAGPPPVDYSVDASGKTVATPRPDTTTSRLQRIAEAALTGLAAGAQMPPQKSKAAAFAGGLGAGAEAQRQQAQGQDLLKRQQSQEEYETQQKSITDKAVRAMHNASTYSLWQKAMDEQNDHDPERKKNMDLVDSINDYNSRNPGYDSRTGSGLQVQIVGPEAAMAVREADKHSVAKHTFLPLGITQAKDANGQPLFEADGVTPKQTGQIAVISGDGNFPLPQSFVDDLKEYGKLAGISGADRLTAGTVVTLPFFLNADKRMNDIKAKEQDGWKTAVPGVAADGKTPVLINSFNRKTRPNPEGAVPLAVTKEEADISEKKAGAFQKTKEGEKAAEETKQLQQWDTNGPDGKGRTDVFGNPVGAPGMDKKEYLKRVDTYTKDYSKDLNQLDAARSQLSDIIKNAEKTKKLPGADAVVGIFDAIGISSAPLKGRGFRINNSVVSEHVEGTRNAWQGMALKLSRLTPEGTGQIVSLEQLKDYERIMNQARQDAYVGAGNDAVNRGIGIQFAPRGSGRPVDANTIDIFLTLAKGDSKRASALLKQYGWVAPQGD